MLASAQRIQVELRELEDVLLWVPLGLGLAALAEEHVAEERSWGGGLDCPPSARLLDVLRGMVIASAVT